MIEQTPLASIIGVKAYAAMLADPVQFVRAFDRPPWPFQQDILREVLTQDPSGRFERSTAVVSMPRQNGKTTLATWAGAWRFLVDPSLGDGVVLSVALDFEGARVAFGDAVRLVKGSEVLSALLDPSWGLTRNEIRLRDGRRWLIRSAEAIRSRGLRVGCLLYDELGWAVSADLFETLSAAMAAQPNPLMLAVSTVGPVQTGPLWSLFESAERGDPGVRLIYHTENLSPLISKEFLERQKEILPSNIFSREHENKWGSSSDVFATHDDWKRATSDGDPRRASEVGPSYLFCDLGWVHDLTTIAIAKVNDEKIDILHLETFKGSQSDPVQLEAVQIRIENLGRLFGLKRVEIESPQGLMLSQKIDIPYCEVTTLHPTLKSNQERWGEFYRALKNGSIRLPPDGNLRRELLTLTIEERATGWRVQDVPSIHNDRSTAVAGALYLASGVGRSRWAETEFLAITERGVIGPGGKLLEVGKTDRPAWMPPTGSELRRREEERQLASLSPGRKVRVRQMAAMGKSVVQLQRQFSLSRRQVEQLLDGRASH